MQDNNNQDKLHRRNILRTTGATIGSGLILGATGTASAKESGSDQGRGDEFNCSGENISRKRVETEDNAIAVIVEVSGKKYLFREAEKYRHSSGPSTQSTYKATRSGHPLEFGEIDPAATTSDISTAGDVEAQGVDFTPENFIEDYDVDTKQISDSCGDIAFNHHSAVEFHLQGGGAFSSIGVSGLSALVCYVAGAAGSIPTGGWSGAAAAVGCGGFAAAVDQLIDIDMIPNKASMTVSYWDKDEEYPGGINTSPTIMMGVAGGYYKDWDEMGVSKEFDYNVHLPV
ncbi:hypothetical protein ACERIM_09070 [Natrinema sp. H-ect1]|uniref:hypothetical protein n=1 Tax=Natrinema sp. H-ect1 TaxID=3242700 RepID=UPI00359E8FE0